jgi:Delta14-sterol reductase
MDITSDGFGFMLSVGDLAWVPFVYSLQARYLAFNQIELGPYKTAAIIGANALGYYIFRDSNGEKNDFRNGKNPRRECKQFHSVVLDDELDFLQNFCTCKRSEAPNYWYRVGGECASTQTICVYSPSFFLQCYSCAGPCSGDWLMAVAWCLPTEFNTPVTYFYPIYFAVLLLHRQLRDDEACHQK